MGWSLYGILWTLHEKYSFLFLHRLTSWYGISSPFVHPLVLVLVQEWLAVSVISFRVVVAQLFGCKSELSAFFNVFRGVHHYARGIVCWFDG